MKYVYPYFLRSTYSPSFMDLILRFDRMQMEGRTNGQYQKMEYLREKGLKLKKPYLNAHLHINIISHIYFQENPSSGLGEVAITHFF